MAENKKTFVFYSDWINMISEMPNADAGELLKHILGYVNDENPTTDNILVKMAFGHMKPLLKSDLVKWDGIRKKRSEYGKKGGQAKAKQTQANAKQVEAVNVNVNDSVTVNGNVIQYKEYVALFNSLTGKNYKTIPDKAKRQIKARVADGFTFTDFEKAINNCKNNEYHIENTHHLTLEFISRADKFEKWLNADDNSNRYVPLYADQP